MSYIIEPQRRTPVAHDVDVAVAGAGIAGTMAAIAAARQGASAVLADRFGTIGGNMVQGGWCAGGMHLALGFPDAFPRGLGGTPGEFLERLEAMDREFGPTRNLADRANRIGHLTFQMATEAGVELMLSGYVAGPILEDEHIVRGLIVENKSGRQAVRARVTIDATGDAAVAARAGAPLTACNWEPSAGISFGIAGIDEERFQQFLAGREEIPEEFDRWVDEVLVPDVGYCQGRLGAHINRLRPIADLVRRAWEEDGYCAVGHIADIGRIAIVLPWTDKGPREGAAWGRADIEGKIDTLDAEHVTAMERDARVYMFETVQFFRRYVPGFEDAYLLYLGPFLGARGGRSIEGERVITKDDCAAARKFDDVIYRFQDTRDNKEEMADIPYRMLLPRRVEGLLAAGRSAHRKPPNLRTRWSVMMMGQAAGVAAALSAQEGIYPRQLDVKKLQRVLLDLGAELGPPERVADLLGAPGDEATPG